MKIDYDVVLATYNGSRYIKEQLDSIIEQTVPPKNIYIRDDLSNDDTIKVLSHYRALPMIKFLESSTNLGYIKNFETLAKATSSDIVFFCDQDDFWFPNKAEILLSKFNNDIDLVFSDAEVTDERLCFQSYLFDLNGLNKNGFSIRSLFMNNFVTGATMAIKRSFLLKNMPFPNSIPHDFYLATSALIQNRVGYVQQPLIQYRQHNNNVIGVRRSSFVEKMQRFKQTRKRWTDRAKVSYELSILFQKQLDSKFTNLLQFRYACLNKGWFIRTVYISFRLFEYLDAFDFKFFVKDLFLLRKN